MPLNNFGIVSLVSSPTGEHTGIIFRAAQPDDKGYQDASLCGIKLIVKLNPEVAIGKRYGRVQTFDVGQWHPNDAAVRVAVEAIRVGSETGGVLVHCTHGRDRTGMVIAAYRILVGGRSVETALVEFREYGATGIIEMADRNIEAYLRGLEAKKVA